MTARSRGVALVVVLAITAGCREEPTDRSSDERELHDDIAALSSEDVEERGWGAFGVARVCCGHTRDSWRPELARLRPRACQELAHVLATERDPSILARVLPSETPSCSMAIPTRIIVDLCGGGCTPEVRMWMHRWLAGVDPSPEVVRAILGQIHPPPPGVDPNPHSGSLGRALAYFGEDDLGPVVEALSDPDPFVRDVAASALSDAIGKAPLDLPQALEGLERLTTDPDKDLASYAEVVAESYRDRMKEPPNATAVRFIEDGELSFAEIRMLAVRKFSCKAKSARPLLELVASGWKSPRELESRKQYGIDNPQRAFAAQRALEIRARRCGL